MSAHYPTQPTNTDAALAENRENNILPPVTIDGDRNVILIGDIELPGQWIGKGAICVTPGGEDDVNTLTVTFLVGSVDITDNALAQVSVRAQTQ